MANPFVHVELQTTDLKKARDFYAKLFDWKLEDAPVPGFGTYTMIGVGEGTGGGMMTSQTPGVPSLLAVLRRRLRPRVGHAQGEGPRGQGAGRFHGGGRHGEIQHHHRPHGRHARIVAIDAQVSR